MELPELLAPAGNMTKLKIALDYGADAVYCGGKEFGLRAKADNFSRDELIAAVDYVHQRNKKIYLTLNIIPHNIDIEQMEDFLSFLENINLDGLIISDPGVLQLIKDKDISIPLHLSTQANTVNWASVKFWQNQGLERVILARELNKEEIAEISSKTDVGLEVFIHGSMCISYSGRCLLSNYLTNRDANRGNCSQPCRWKYNLVEEKRPGQFFPIENDEQGTYIMNSKDLNLLEEIPALIELGVESLKIEGRMKSVHYLATVTGVYRQALDNFQENPEEFIIKDQWKKELKKVSHRPYTKGFFAGNPGSQGQNYGDSSYIRNYQYLGQVKGFLPDPGLAIVKVKNKICQGDSVEFFGPGGDILKQKITTIIDKNGELIDEAPHPESTIKISVTNPIGENYILRKKIKN